MSTTSLRTLVPRGLAATRESVQSTAVLLGTSLPSIFSSGEAPRNHGPQILSAYLVLQRAEAGHAGLDPVGLVAEFYLGVRF